MIVSIIIPSVCYYIFDYLRIYKIRFVLLFLRLLETLLFKFYLDKVIMLILSLTIFKNIWVFVFYILGAMFKYLIQFLFSTIFGKKYILFIRNREVIHNRRIAEYFIKKFSK